MTAISQCLSLQRPESYSALGKAADVSIHVSKFPQPMIYCPAAGLGKQCCCHGVVAELPYTMNSQHAQIVRDTYAIQLEMNLAAPAMLRWCQAPALVMLASF